VFELLQRLLFGEALLLQTADLLPQKLLNSDDAALQNRVI
jgi:hypothetical protein